MNQRTVITRSIDGNILITREQSDGVSGTARDRRRQRRAGSDIGWHRISRAIERTGELLTWPLGSPYEASGIDRENSAIATIYQLKANEIAEEISEKNSKFSIREPGSCTVTIAWDQEPQC